MNTEGLRHFRVELVNGRSDDCVYKLWWIENGALMLGDWSRTSGRDLQPDIAYAAGQWVSIIELVTGKGEDSAL